MRLPFECDTLTHCFRTSLADISGRKGACEGLVMRVTVSRGETPVTSGAPRARPSAPPARRGGAARPAGSGRPRFPPPTPVVRPGIVDARSTLPHAGARPSHERPHTTLQRDGREH
ncbi:hypothetical protein GCM10010261_42220 [Streptomyces pilosus]|uniref:Uncharacterized protein n=1 Tax=Streptomyces pilosus TaxID=28893 RepID=A0A918EYQ8_9ACTN|nr:hypothetical protein GCM10010280_38350 [Streptomyces pilosus]GGV56781.1 hypothetical protein GCM10010261_42220 [Streptomyces pilosus]